MNIYPKREIMGCLVPCRGEASLECMYVSFFATQIIFKDLIIEILNYLSHF